MRVGGLEEEDRGVLQCWKIWGAWDLDECWRRRIEEYCGAGGAGELAECWSAGGG